MALASFVSKGNLAPEEGCGLPPKKTTTVEATSDETTAVSPKVTPATNHEVVTKSPVQNGAKKTGRGRPPAKVAQSQAKPKAAGRGRPKKEVAEITVADPTKRKAEAEVEDAPPAKSPKTEATIARGCSKKAAVADKKFGQNNRQI